MVSRTSAASPSAPLRKSTGLVATITRTAPVGPITRRLSTPAAPPRLSLRRRRGRPDRHTVDLNLDHSRRPGSTCAVAAPCAARRHGRRRRCRIHDRRHEPQFFGFGNASLSFSAIAAASQTIAAATSPCRRATAETESPLATISATIRALSSSLHVRRRPAPVKTSSRRTGLVIALSTVSILSLTVKTKTADSQIRTSSGR